MEGRLRELDDGEVIFRQNEPSDFACIVEDGLVEVFTEKAEGDVTIAVLDKGQLLGEMGVIDGRPRSASARAKGAARVREFDSGPFLTMISQDPQFASSIMTVLVSRLRQQTSGITLELPPISPPGEAPSETARTDAPPVENPEKVELEDLKAGAADGRKRNPQEKFDGFTEGSPPAEETLPEPTAAPSPATSHGPERSAVGPATEEGAGDGPQRCEPAPGTSQDFMPRETVKKGLPVVLVAPLTNDPNGTLGEMLLTELEKSDAFSPAALTLAEIGTKNADEDARISSARRAITHTGAAIAVLGSVVDGADGDLIELQIVTIWPDEESRIGGFSVHDRFYVPPDLDDIQRNTLFGVIRAGLPGREGRLSESLEALLPSDLPNAKEVGALALDRLTAAQAARQLIVYGNAAARKGKAAGRQSVGLEDAVDAYLEAIETAPDDETLTLGLAHLHRGIVLNAIAEREKSDRHRDMAEQSVSKAAELFDPKQHRYQYLTANARHGAILYRGALLSGSVARCKKGIESFNKALAVCDKNTMQDPWADTMNGLGQLLILVGRLSKKTDFLGWACQVCKNAMEVRSKLHNPLGWARTLNNRATALYLLGRAEGSPDFLAEAMNGFENALEVFEQARISSLIQTAKSNRILVEEALEKLDGGDPTPDHEWWAA